MFQKPKNISHTYIHTSSWNRNRRRKGNIRTCTWVHHIILRNKKNVKYLILNILNGIEIFFHALKAKKYRMAWNIGGSYMFIFGGFASLDFFPRVADYNLSDQSQSSTSHTNIHTSLVEFNLAVLSYIRQSAKLTSPPIFFHAIRYVIHTSSLNI